MLNTCLALRWLAGVDEPPGIQPTPHQHDAPASRAAGPAGAGTNYKPDNLASLLSLLAAVLRLYPDLFLDEMLRYDVLGVFMGHLAAQEVVACRLHTCS